MNLGYRGLPTEGPSGIAAPDPWAQNIRTDAQETGAKPPLWLILGGARSGKSHYAETVTRDLACGRSALYVATGWAGDAEMAARIALHQARRGDGWITHEEQLDLASLIHREARGDRPILIDCLTLWVSNLMHHNRAIQPAFDDLASALGAAAGPVILVANEVGLGIVPDNALARAFRDHAGTLNRRIAAIAAEVRFIAAGLPLTLKTR